jgi:sarcosine oxidase
VSRTSYDADVAVVGVGTMGAMASWQLARRGVQVLGFEQFAPGHDRSGAGGESRLFRTAYLEGSQYVPLLLAAQRLWRDLEGETGRDLLTLNGGLMIGDPEGQLLSSVRASIREHDLPHQELDHDEAARRYPQHRLQENEGMLLDEQSGFLRPELAVTLAAARAESLGARILRHEQVLGIEPEEDGVTVRTEGGAWRTREVVLSAGAWSDRLLPRAVPPLAVQRLVMTWFAAHDPGEFTIDRFPIFIRHTDGHDISGWPTLDGASVKVAVNYGYDCVEDPDRLDRSVEDQLMNVIRSAVAEQLPGLYPEPVRVGAYMDGYTPDRHAVLGAAPGLPHTFLACGFSGHGFKMSPAIGAAVADLVLDGTTTLPVGHLDPHRSLAAGSSVPLRSVATDLTSSLVPTA